MWSITILNKPDTILIGNVMAYDLKNQSPIYKFLKMNQIYVL